MRLADELPGDTTVNRVRPAPGDLGDVREVSRKLSVNWRTVYRLRDRGHMPMPVRLGTRILWNLSTIDRWIEKGCPPTSKI